MRASIGKRSDRGYIMPIPNPNTYTKTPKDEASWLVGAARDALQRTEELGDDPETLIQILQAHVLLGVAIEKLQTAS